MNEPYFYALVFVTGRSGGVPFTDQKACVAFMELRRSQGLEVIVWWYQRDSFGAAHWTDQMWKGSWL